MRYTATVVTALATALISISANAQGRIVSAPEIIEQMETGDIILLDIRSKDEWNETGLAEGAWPVSLHSRDFPERLQALMTRYKPEQIALICATGGRTQFVTDILKKNGVEGVIDVSEGMHGNDLGPGWLARGLPVVPLAEARAAYHEAILKN